MSNQNKPPQFIWTYWNEGAVEDELRWSLRSIQKFCKEPPQVIVAGDPPSWFRGKVIFLPKIDEVPNHNFQDVLWKLWKIVNHQDVADEFIWMMDDIVAIHRFSFEDIRTPRAVQFVDSEVSLRTKKYLRLKANTLKVLKSRGYSGSWDFGTHAPHLVKKKVLQSIFQTWPIQSQTLLWEIIYEAVVNNIREGEVVQSPSPFLTTQSSPYSLDQLQEIQKDSSRIFLNWGNKNGWTPILRNWLQQILPNHSAHEMSDV